MKRYAVTFIALISVATLVGCSKDSTPAAAPTPSAADTATTRDATTRDATSPETATPATSMAATFDMSAFCGAKMAFDGVNSDTPDEAAFDSYVAEASARAGDIVATAPPELQEAANTVASTLAGLRDLDDGTAAHANEPYAAARETLAKAVHDRCGFGHLALDIVDNAYSSEPGEVTGGATSVLVNNADTAVHVTIIAKLAEGFTADQLLAKPDLFETKATIVGAVFTGPHRADGTAVALSAGNYIYFDPEHVEDGMTGSFSLPS